MKKHICLLITAIFIIIITLPASLALASDITDAQWYGAVTITSSNSSAASNVATIFTANTSAMISAGFLNSSADNCAILNASGVDVPFMPGYGTSPWAVFVNSISGLTTLTDTLYTGNVTGGAIRYSPGSTGVSVPDGMTEPGNSFQVDMTNIFPILSTSTTSTPTIRAQNNGANTAAIVPVAMPAGWQSGDGLIAIIDLYDAGGAASPVISTPAGWTQAWHTAEAAQKRYAAYYKTADGTEANPTNFTVDRNSYYSFRSIAITVGTFSAITNGVTATGAATNPDPSTVTASIDWGGTNLFIANCGAQVNMASAPANYAGLQVQGANSAYISIATRTLAAANDNPGTFGTASAAWAANTIVVTSSAPSNPIISHYDAINGGIIVYPSSSSGITCRTLGAGATSFTISGLTETEYSHSILTLSGGTLSLTVGASSNSTAFAGSIPNSTSPWYFADGDGVLYVNSINYLQGGGTTDITWHWGYGATFPGHKHVGDVIINYVDAIGTPSFRTTSSHTSVNAVLSTFSPVTEAKASVSAVSVSDPWTTAPAKPSGLTTPSGSISIPFVYDILHNFFQANPAYGTATEKLFWYLMSLLFILVGGFLAQKYGKSIVIKGVVMGVLMLGGALSNVYGLWTLITFTCYAYGIIIMSRHYGFS